MMASKISWTYRTPVSGQDTFASCEMVYRAKAAVSAGGIFNASPTMPKSAYWKVARFIFVDGENRLRAVGADHVGSARRSPPPDTVQV